MKKIHYYFEYITDICGLSDLNNVEELFFNYSFDRYLTLKINMFVAYTIVIAVS